MGFLHKLWDETLAGPTPETGLARLRKHGSLPAEPQASKEADRVRVSRSITIARNSQKPNPATSSLKNLSVDVSGSASPSSSAATTPRTPLTPGTPVFRRWTSMKLPGTADMSEGAEPRAMKHSDRTGLTEKEASHLMIMMSALDR